ncbi:MAG TPA: TIR domain-containing protein [Candidatus Kapabacteria bacterium]|jgi:adenylate cyclase
MPDIFISYSRQDSEQAHLLTELLSSAGLSVWIDHSGIDAATSWSGEIVDAIDGCKAMIVMLSPNSIASRNVIKEVSLAAEQHKKILPLDVEPVELPRDLKYHLAGIQRAPISNIDAIIRALAKLGLEATGAPQAPKIVKEQSLLADGSSRLGKAGEMRKSLMVLPFEDLSPTGDNQWFVDGMASELVNTLSNVKSLKLIDWNTSSMLKNKKVRTIDLAKDFSVRYFIEGQVRKFGDQIKISITLLDIETGDHLWQDSLRGTMEDVFDIQEQVAKKVLAGLDLILTKKEEAIVKKKPTENAEAYELYLKAQQYQARQTKRDIQRALALHEEAARLDPKFAMAFAGIAATCTAIYRVYDRQLTWLERADGAADKVREIEGETALYFWVMSHIALPRGNAESALRYAEQALERDPNYAAAYDALSFALQTLGRHKEAAQVLAEYVRLRENETGAHFTLLIALKELEQVQPSLSNDHTPSDYSEQLRAAAERATPIFERHIRLNPDDENARVQFANVLSMAGRDAEALAAAEKLSLVESLDGAALYNLACLYLKLHAQERGMEMLRAAIAKGFRNIEDFRSDPDLAPLRETPEFEALMKELEPTKIPINPRV